MKVPVNEPLVSAQSKKNIQEAVETGWISSAGKFVEQFEANFAQYLGMKYAITVSNGTAAIHVALLALGIKPGDEVIVPAFTMAGTWLPVLYCGATPVFVDCELETYNLDPTLIEAKITKKTKAIIPVHLYGHAAEMDQIMAIAKKHRLAVIEDAAEVHGGEYHGQKCGTFGDIACFSFYGNKILTMGEGGALVTNSSTLAAKIRKIKDLYHSEKRFIHADIGYNYRLTNMQAALGCGELENIEKYLQRKQRMAELYNRELREIPGLRLPITKPGVKNVYWMYAILVDAKTFGMDKDTLRSKLKAEGIDTRDFFYPPTSQPVLTKRLKFSETFSNTEYAANNGLYLPSGLALTEEQILYVCQKIKQVYQTK